MRRYHLLLFLILLQFLLLVLHAKSEEASAVTTRPKIKRQRSRQNGPQNGERGDQYNSDYDDYEDYDNYEENQGNRGKKLIFYFYLCFYFEKKGFCSCYPGRN